MYRDIVVSSDPEMDLPQKLGEAADPVASCAQEVVDVLREETDSCIVYR